MGSPLSPALANLSMSDFVRRALQTTSFKPKLWIMYVADTFVIWPLGERELDSFLNHLNGVHPRIKCIVTLLEWGADLNAATCRDWFRHLKGGDFDVDDRPFEGRPETFEDAVLERFLNKDPCQTQQEHSSVLGVTRQVISKPFHALRIIQKQGTSVPYGLKPRDVERRFFACEQLLQRQKRKDFLHHIPMGDEK
ncbi:hypothetical protein Trydic_g19613 [Trypoxylus dichotomus]